MAVFSFLVTEIAIDLGAESTIIVYNDQVVFDEPSLVAISKSSNEVIAIGARAEAYYSDQNNYVVSPIVDDAITNYRLAKFMLKEMIKTVFPRNPLFGRRYRVVLSFPLGLDDVDKMNYYDFINSLNFKYVKLIPAPLAQAIGIGIDVLEPCGNLIVDFGKSSTRIVVIKSGSIQLYKVIRVGGDYLTTILLKKLSEDYKIILDQKLVEELKTQKGFKGDTNEKQIIYGKDFSNKNKNISINYSEILEYLDEPLAEIENSVMKILEDLTPTLYNDIASTGIYLAGGGALVKDIDRRLHYKTKFPVHMAEDPKRACIRGVGISLKNWSKFIFLFKPIS